MSDAYNMDSHEGDPTYVSEEALAALAQERTTIREGETDEQQARRLFKENAAHAALQIIALSKHGSNDRIRLDASKYVIERVLGKIGDDAFSGVQSPIDELINEVTTYVNAQAPGSDMGGTE